MATTATDPTSEHYQRAEVKKTILRCCQDGEAWRCLNGDTTWYRHIKDEYVHHVRLLNPDDYDDVTRMWRTLYWTLDLFEPEVKGLERNWMATSEEEDWRGKPESPLLDAFNPAILTAKEAAAQMATKAGKFLRGGRGR